MQTLRSICSHCLRSKPYLSFYQSSQFRSPNRATIHRNIRISFRKCSSNGGGDSVWTGYDPTSGQLVTSRSSGHGAKAASLRSLDSSGEESGEEGRNEAVRALEKPMIRSGYDLAGVKRKKGKSRSVWVCSNCGKSFGQWWGACGSCGSSGTVVEFADGERSESRVNTGFGASENAVSSWLQRGSRGSTASEIEGSAAGVEPGDLEGAIIAAMIAEGQDFGRESPVIYVSGEESIEQIGNRADRMRIGTDELFLYSSTDIEDILQKIQPLSPRALIVDSIQTVYLKGVAGSAGGVIQVKECTSALLRFAKDTNIPVLLVGHVTKTGDIAGPRVLEHIVDVVLYMEGEKYSNHRFLRSVKNRFGSTDELGVFEMCPSGLQAVVNPSEMFLGEQCFDSEVLAGLAVAVIIDGSRTFLIEIQALCLHDSSSERQFTGVDKSRAGLIIAVLIKQAGLKLQDHAIFVNVVSGVKLEDTAGDLAIAASICSSFLEFPVPNNVAFIGEIGLGGELRPVPRMDKRVTAVAKLGYKKCIVPKSAEESLASLQLELEILGCKNLREVINSVFR
ncbi:hypothetical protein Sjap_011560 [Stephania japonica]|uniref:RecA family profile 1 domain-containing protein n=1 Tax=Stephania japonica TaxID=461633 RepID=A0AAP0JDP3_9MAGN